MRFDLFTGRFLFVYCSILTLTLPGAEPISVIFRQNDGSLDANATSEFHRDFADGRRQTEQAIPRAADAVAIVETSSKSLPVFVAAFFENSPTACGTPRHAQCDLVAAVRDMFPSVQIRLQI